MEKAREFQKNIYFCFIDYAKAFDCMDHNKLENSKRDENTGPFYLSPGKSVCRSRSNRTRHGKTGSKLGKEYLKAVYCILSPGLFNFSAEYIMRNAGLNEAPAGIKIAGRNINNLRYADDIPL